MVEDVGMPTVRLREWQWVLVDVLVAAVLAFGYLTGPNRAADLPAWCGPVLAGAACLPLAWRRRFPTQVAAVVLLATTGEAVLGFAKVPYLAVAYALYPVAARGSLRLAWWALGAAGVDVVLYLAAGWAAVPFDGRLGVIAGPATTVCAAFALGVAVRLQHRYVAGIREQARRREERVRADAERAVTEQRLGIARELHDIVAHGLGVIAVQAGVGNYLLAEQPERAGVALEVIESISRGALDDMRHLLHVLRSDIDGSELAPTPGLRDLAGLVTRTGQAGTTADIEVTGRQRPLPRGVDVTAYRIVQEALANVIKHAGTARCTVRIHYGEEELAIDVQDDGPGRSGGGTGYGLIGMRERVTAYGGRLVAGPRPERGYRIRASIPVPAL